jgi:fumarate reductase flavoprotein subunit
MATLPKNHDETLQTDIVIIGGGGSGLTAAVAAAEKQARVMVLEKRAVPGGNSSLAGGIFAAESPVQERQDIHTSKDVFFKAAMDHAHWKINPKIVRTIIDRSGDTIQWLEDKGIDFEIPMFYPDLPKTIHTTKTRGAGIIKGLVDLCESLDVNIMCKAEVKKILITEKGVIQGVLAASGDKVFQIVAKGVVIASGGYAGNKDFLRKYFPYYSENLHPIGLPHTGDGLRMAIETGSATEGLGILHLRGPYFQGAMECVVAAMQPNTIWVNKSGERFVDEGKAYYWPEAANALNMQLDKVCYAIMDEALKKTYEEKGIVLGSGGVRDNEALSGLGQKIDQEIAEDRIKMSDSWDAVAEWIGASPAVFTRTIHDYNTSCGQRYDSQLLKDPKFLTPLTTPPYYALKCGQGFFGTIGGIKINHRMEVLNQKDESPIPGLYAAGNDTGGWESDTYSLSLPGLTFGFAINSGRIAGENAAAYVSG